MQSRKTRTREKHAERGHRERLTQGNYSIESRRLIRIESNRIELVVSWLAARRGHLQAHVPEGAYRSNGGPNVRDAFGLQIMVFNGRKHLLCIKICFYSSERIVCLIERICAAERREHLTDAISGALRSQVHSVLYGDAHERTKRGYCNGSEAFTEAQVLQLKIKC